MSRIGESHNFSNAPSIIRFATKEAALNYVLKEAKKRFKGYNMIKFNDGELTEVMGEIYISINRKNRILADWFPIWDEDSGFIAEPYKEDPLRLGDVEVEILDGHIKAGKFECTKKEWLDWEKVFLSVAEFGGNAELDLGDWRSAVLDGQYISIGLIRHIKIYQIEAITKKLKEDIN